jgi:phosphoserine aminotransferase
LAWADAKTKASSKLLYDWADATSFASAFVSNPKHRSQVVVTIDFDVQSTQPRLLRCFALTVWWM